METTRQILEMVSSIAPSVPAIMLLFLAIMFTWILWKTQRRPDFDLADMLKDDGGRPSAARLSAFVCLGISSWAIMYMIIKDVGQIDRVIFIAYVGIWSGAKVVEKAIDAYSATRGAPIGDRTSVVTTPDLTADIAK